MGDVQFLFHCVSDSRDESSGQSFLRIRICACFIIYQNCIVTAIEGVNLRVGEVLSEVGISGGDANLHVAHSNDLTGSLLFKGDTDERLVANLSLGLSCTVSKLFAITIYNLGTEGLAILVDSSPCRLGLATYVVTDEFEDIADALLSLQCAVSSLSVNSHIGTTILISHVSVHQFSQVNTCVVVRNRECSGCSNCISSGSVEMVVTSHGGVRSRLIETSAIGGVNRIECLVHAEVGDEACTQGSIVRSDGGIFNSIGVLESDDGHFLVSSDVLDERSIQNLSLHSELASLGSNRGDGQLVRSKSLVELTIQRQELILLNILGNVCSGGVQVVCSHDFGSNNDCVTLSSNIASLIIIDLSFQQTSQALEVERAHFDSLNAMIVSSGLEHECTERLPEEVDEVSVDLLNLLIEIVNLTLKFCLSFSNGSCISSGDFVLSVLNGLVTINHFLVNCILNGSCISSGDFVLSVLNGLVTINHFLSDGSFTVGDFLSNSAIKTCDLFVHLLAEVVDLILKRDDSSIKLAFQVIDGSDTFLRLLLVGSIAGTSLVLDGLSQPGVELRDLVFEGSLLVSDECAEFAIKLSDGSSEFATDSCDILLASFHLFVDGIPQFLLVSAGEIVILDSLDALVNCLVESLKSLILELEFLHGSLASSLLCVDGSDTGIFLSLHSSDTGSLFVIDVALEDSLSSEGTSLLVVDGLLQLPLSVCQVVTEVLQGSVDVSNSFVEHRLVNLLGQCCLNLLEGVLSQIETGLKVGNTSHGVVEVGSEFALCSLGASNLVVEVRSQSLLSSLCTSLLLGEVIPQGSDLSLQVCLSLGEGSLQVGDVLVILVNLLLKGVDVVIIVLTRNKRTRRSNGERSEQECC